MLKDYDGFLFGFPTRYGRATAAVSAFFVSSRAFLRSLSDP